MANPDPVLVDQPTGAPTRKVWRGFIAAIVTVFAGKTIPVIFPNVVDPASPWQPLYMEVLTWLPLIIPIISYRVAEWTKPPIVIVPPSDTQTVVQPGTINPTGVRP